MRELSVQDIQQVSGAGFIQDIGTNVGSGIGGIIFGLSKDYLNVNVPFLGTVNIGDLFPNLGHEIGGNIGGSLGGTVESTLGSIPLVGGLFNVIFNK